MKLNFIEVPLSTDYEKVSLAATKKPHELLTSEIYHWFDIERLRRSRILSRIRLPEPELNPVVGSYARARDGKDEWLGRFDFLNPHSIIINSYEKIKLDWIEVTYREQCATRMEWKEYGKLSPIPVYKDSQGRYVAIFGTTRLLYAQELDLSKVGVFVVETNNSYAMNRTLYVRKAKELGIVIEPKVVRELIDHPSTPLYCPTLSTEDVLLLHGPTVGDKLDAILKMLESAEPAECKRLLEIIKSF